MEIPRGDFDNLIDQLWEHALDSAGYDVFYEGAETILSEFDVYAEEDYMEDIDKFILSLSKKRYIPLKKKMALRSAMINGLQG